MTVKNSSARKEPRQFLYTLKVKPRTSVGSFCAAESKRKAIRADSMLRSGIPKRRGYSKISLQLDSTASSGCGVSNIKWLSQIIH